jgi:hypothetical protein
MALAFGAVTMYTTARIINKLLTGSYHMETKNAFSIVYGKRAYSLRTVQGDLLHLITEPGQFAYSRLNPLYGRTSLEFVTGRDFFGRKRSGLEQLQDLASTIVPISLRGVTGVTGQEQAWWESFLNAFGITEHRSAAIDNIYRLVENFKKAHKEMPGQPGEFIYDPDKDRYRGIKNALMFSGQADAVKELHKAVDGGMKPDDIKEHFKTYASRPFTGSRKWDSKFLKEMSADNRVIYNDAIKERHELMTKFQAAYAQFLKEYREKKKANVHIP